jgi:hypothetical protein
VRAIELPNLSKSFVLYKTKLGLRFGFAGAPQPHDREAQQTKTGEDFFLGVQSEINQKRPRSKSVAPG